MAIKKIIWSNRAEFELQKNLEFYSKRNGNTIYSLKLLNKIEELLETLSKSHFIGRLTSNKKTRVIVMSKFLIFYEIDDDIIKILSFWDNRQDDKNRIEI